VTANRQIGVLDPLSSFVDPQHSMRALDGLILMIEASAD